MTHNSLRIDDVALRRLGEIAEWRGISLADALTQAVTDLHDRAFWESVNSGYAALRADPEAWAAEQAERRLWEDTLADGLDPLFTIRLMVSILSSAGLHPGRGMT